MIRPRCLRCWVWAKRGPWRFLQRKTGKLTVLDAAALDLEAYPGWLRAPVSALVLNRLAALYCDEMSYAMGHPISSRRYMGVEKY